MPTPPAMPPTGNPPTGTPPPGGRLIVVQIDRQGYRCSRCQAFHRMGDADGLFDAHEAHAREGPTYYVETHCWHVDEGGAVRLPAAVGRAALRRATS